MLQFIRDHKYVTAGAAAGLLAVVAWLTFGYFGVQYLFIDDEVAEALPTFDAPAVTDDDLVDEVEASATGGEVGGVSDDTAESAEDATAEPAGTGEATEDVAAEPAGTDEAAEDATPEPAVADEAAEDATAEPAVAEIVTEYTGSFVADAHPAVGTAVVLGNGTGQRFLRFEDDFATDNGPDLNVYLVNSSVDGVSDFVDLGDLTGNVGSQNYEIPADVDLDVYDQVYVWCVRFGVGFGSADLMAV